MMAYPGSCASPIVRTLYEVDIGTCQISCMSYFDCVSVTFNDTSRGKGVTGTCEFRQDNCLDIEPDATSLLLRFKGIFLHFD